jgi:hypothetical protein
LRVNSSDSTPAAVAEADRDAGDGGGDVDRLAGAAHDVGQREDAWQRAGDGEAGEVVAAGRAVVVAVEKVAGRCR